MQASCWLGFSCCDGCAGTNFHKTTRLVWVAYSFIGTNAAHTSFLNISRGSRGYWESCPLATIFLLCLAGEGKVLFYSILLCSVWFQLDPCLGACWCLIVSQYFGHQKPFLEGAGYTRGRSWFWFWSSIRFHCRCRYRCCFGTRFS